MKPCRVDITMGQLRQIASTVNLYGDPFTTLDENTGRSVNLGCNASDNLISKLRECPGAVYKRKPVSVMGVTKALEIVTLTVDGVEFVAQRALPMEVIDGAA